MFWNKKLTQERDFERARAGDALVLVETQRKQIEKLNTDLESMKLQCKTFASDANKVRDDKSELEKHARALESSLSFNATRLQQETESLGKCQLSLDHFGDVVSEIHSLAVTYSPIAVDGLKNNSTLKIKLKEAQSLIGRIFEKSKGSE